MPARVFSQSLYTKCCSQRFTANEAMRWLQSDMLRKRTLHAYGTLYAYEGMTGTFTVACPGCFLLALYEWTKNQQRLQLSLLSNPGDRKQGFYYPSHPR